MQTNTEADPVGSGDSLAGSLPDLPDIMWEDFERASVLTRRDLLDALADAQTMSEDEDYVSAAPAPDFGPED